MRFHRVLVAAAIACALASSRSAAAQADPPSIQLVVESGTPLRVVVDRNVRIKRAGQPVTGTLAEPVFAYDRIVLPAGTKAIGHVAGLVGPTRKARVRAMLGGDFTPIHKVLVQFDSLILSDGRTIAVQTSPSTGTARVVLKVAASPDADSVRARAREEIERQAKEGIALLKAPGKMARLKEMAIGALPYHPEVLRKGTVYSATVASALDFGGATPAERAPAGATAAPESILNARLITALDSATTLSGSRIDAVLTQPVFSADRRLILPQGTRLTGTVTLTKRARRFHRNGQLRFLFEGVTAPDREPAKLLASLYSVQTSQDDRVTIDDEGGAAASGSKARFAGPALATLALAGSLHGRVDYDTDGAGPEMQYGGAGSSALGGFLGASALGVALSQFSRPVTLTIGVVGLARTGYSAVFGRGRNVSFPANTSIQIQLAPGPGAKKD